MIERVYYINLKHREDRRKGVEGTLKDVELFNISERVEGIRRKNGALGCCLSHIFVLEKFLETGYSNCLIIEDDFRFIDINRSKLSLSLLNNIEYDVIQLSGNHRSLINVKYPCLKQVLQSRTTSGYLVSREFAPKLLEVFNESKESLLRNGYKGNCNAIDVMWQKLQPNSKWFAFYPALGRQVRSYSDIRKVISDYKC